MSKPSRLLITMGDVAGIGPEIIARAWPELTRLASVTVVGAPDSLERALRLVGSPHPAVMVTDTEAASTGQTAVRCLAGSSVDVSKVQAGRASAVAGRAAYDFLCAAIDLTMAGRADAIVTAPLNKEGLREAGLPYPGHTEILAERTGASKYAMLLHVPGLTVAHVTLHTRLRDVFQQITTEAVLDKIRVLDDFLRGLLGRPPRIAVAGLNPHASDGGLFGDEEERIIRPAVNAARAADIDASGPWPVDTLFQRARTGKHDGIVVMYHDQGHIAMKLLGGFRTVNVTAGLPVIRTSVAHGTAYDIAWRGMADASSLIEATRVAAQLVTARRASP